MKYRKFRAEHNEFRFDIEEDNPGVGFYMYIFKGEKEIRDELQDDLETCKKIAFEDYGVPYNSWRELKDEHLGNISN